jgi:hypothetical protein
LKNFLIVGLSSPYAYKYFFVLPIPFLNATTSGVPKSESFGFLNPSTVTVIDLIPSPFELSGGSGPYFLFRQHPGKQLDGESLRHHFWRRVEGICSTVHSGR